MHLIFHPDLRNYNTNGGAAMLSSGTLEGQGGGRSYLHTLIISYPTFKVKQINYSVQIILNGFNSSITPKQGPPNGSCMGFVKAKNTPPFHENICTESNKKMPGQTEDIQTV